MSILTESIFLPSNNSQDFDKIKINLASSETIRSWSHGEITKSETINYRTFKPENSGLFCATVFGPVKNYECLCEKYKGIKYKGIICEKCQVEVTLSRVRRERMGHINLVSPVAHTWFLRSSPSKIGTLLDINSKNLDKILYFESSIIVESEIKSLKEGTLLTNEELEEAKNQYGEENFNAMIGAEAIEFMLKKIDLKSLKDTLQKNLKDCNSEIKRKKIVKCLKITKSFLSSDNKPEWMIINVLPICPTEIRPLIMLESGRFATSDLNELYKRIIIRNNRLKRLIHLQAPEVIINNEKRMLQESVDTLWDNNKKGKIVKNSNRRPLKSIGDMLKGKQGRFRQNLLGKRVDYSGRSVIVVDPTMKLHQCGIPKKMALELFKPFLCGELSKRGMASSIRMAKKLISSEAVEIWDALEKVVRHHPVILNRAPTLHRLSMQAFEPILVEGQAIHLHPLVCGAFNADFDGDQMAVHVPLSIESQVEARVLMMSTNNILSLANGQPLISPTKDIVLGLHYLTIMVCDQKNNIKTFSSFLEVETALAHKAINIHTEIRCRLPSYYTDSERIVSTTAGRIKLAQVIPKHEKITFSIINKIFNKKDLSKIVEITYNCCGAKETVILADTLKDLGFEYSFSSGLSFGVDDMIVPLSKKDHIKNTTLEVSKFDSQYQEGLITKSEKYNKVIDAWSECTDQVTEDVIKMIKYPDKIETIQNLNNVYLMSNSGARGSTEQIKQLSGMRGLMVKPSGEIMEEPIKSNFKEGLSVSEYFKSTHGARKGLADTALKTANAGYFTRRLVDVALDCFITEEDCNTQEGIEISSYENDQVTIIDISERIYGRIIIENILDDKNKIIIPQNTLILEEEIQIIKDLKIKTLLVRSPITCKTKQGICCKCYGLDLSNKEIVSLGESVGVIAAQSIGEPGTQLTLKTFHIGGAASIKVEESYIDSPENGVVILNNDFSAINTIGKRIIMGKSCTMEIRKSLKSEKILAKYNLGYATTLLVKNHDKIKKGQRLAEKDSHITPILATHSGKVIFEEINDLSMKNILDSETGLFEKVITDIKNTSDNISPRIKIENKDIESKENTIYLPTNTILNVEEGDIVKRGDLLAKINMESTKTSDIIGGLPRVVDLFEARHVKQPAILAEEDGFIEFSKDYKNKLKIKLKSSEEKVIEHTVNKNRHIVVSDGDFVKKGTFLVEGQESLQDILKIRGVNALATHIINEVQSVYRLQGVEIGDKHIEIIVKQMLSRVEIFKPGDTTFLSGEKVNISHFNKVNEETIKNNEKPAECKPLISGITKIAIQTDSFISAAAFQETTKVLTEAAISSKVDKLESLKENVIIGRLIPVGTGFYSNKINKENK